MKRLSALLADLWPLLAFVAFAFAPCVWFLVRLYHAAQAVTINAF